MLSLRYDALDDKLWLGSYPQQPEDVLHLKSLGITAVLSVQSNADLDERAINWDLFWRFYVRSGMESVRHPITDFDDADLLRHLSGAVDALQTLFSNGHRVYLHCTAGLNRSPTVAIGWYHVHGGMPMDEAIKFVTARHSCAPNTEVLARWTPDKS